MNVEINPETAEIGVIGAGSWGTAIAGLLAGKGHSVTLWAFEEEVREQIRVDHENRVFLPGVTLPDSLEVTGDIAAAVSGKNMVVSVVPSHVLRQVATRLKGLLSDDTVIVTASKGIEVKTHLTMAGVLEDVLDDVPKELFAVLSGPSFAREVAAGVPTVVTAASRSLKTARYVQQVFATPSFRVYTNDDMTGVELGGAVKNVIAIAAGMVDGMGLGLNTRAALITRGLTEIRRLGVAMGASPRTFAGLAGVGDLILTCTGDLSRNHTVGKRIGEGMTLKQILSEMRMVAEGVINAKSVYNLSRDMNVEMPISNAVYQILYEDLSPREALFRLMTRDLKNELDER